MTRTTPRPASSTTRSALRPASIAPTSDSPQAAAGDVVHAATTAPAAAWGLSDVGAIEAGRRADLVVLDDALDVIRVMRAGVWQVP